MNVAFDAWIPVVTITGEPKLVSLCEALTEGDKFADLAVRPHERVALMRLFLCVSHAALKGPKNFDEWRDVSKRLPDEACQYLDVWKDSFELFHPKKPWLQVVGLRKSSDKQDAGVDGWTPASKLCFFFATGGNTTLFDHGGMDSAGRAIPPQDSLLSMLTFQCFSPGGLISQVYWNSSQTAKSSRDAPCVSASMMHAFLRGNDLADSIRLNLPTFQDVCRSYGTSELGRPVWEQMPSSMNDQAKIKNATETYIGRLVPITRLIQFHLNGKQILLGDGLVYRSFTDGFPPEPSATVVVRKDRRGLLSYRPQRAIWRELGAVLAKRNAEGIGGPLTLRALQDGDECDLVVAALARDQATIVDTIESVFHIPARLRSPNGAAVYESEVRESEFIASRLGWAIEAYRSAFDGGWEGRMKGAGPSKWELKTKLHSAALIHYWTMVEKNLPLLMAHIEAIGTDNAMPTRDAWRRMLFAKACEAYRATCGHETPRQMHAFTEGWKELVSKKKDSETESPEKEEGA